MRTALIGAIIAVSIVSARADVLPACGNENAIRSALQLGIQEKTGVTNQSIADVMTIESARPLGIDKTTDAKTCRVTFRCNPDKAKALEKDVVGRHPLGQFCWSVNYLADTGNGALLFTVRPDGEGGYLIKMKPDEGLFDELWNIFSPRAEVEPIPQSPTPPPSPSGNWIGEGPIVVRGNPTRITWQNVEQRRLIVYRSRFPSFQISP